MPILHLLLVAVIQGLTEFLPVSSSGHLILLPNLTGLADQGLAIDVAVHLGTLGAVVLYFWRDVRAAVAGVPKLIRWQIDDQNSWLALCLIVSTIPVVILGLVIKLTGLDVAMRSVAMIGWTMILFGILLYWADQKGPTIKTGEHWSLKDAVTMGLWQAVALIPGTSRSGITISAARWLGYERHGAARLSMLMSIPTILASGAVLSLDVIGEADWALARDAGIAAVFAFVSALLALALMMRLLRSVSFTPYVIYRVILGIILLAIAYG
ncbi:undecaprenyl-diphosphate phosphatase [Anianabacter salinae]|uniref:undecaprenyl-diphosphate phosphatase n=1 Tax=Anianabacter salinae TaxID=2851023 RepID=UPI00225E4B3C|nr:undecaprenyl-diphosphate phosphatase [Anianabacter salinae]MBV0913589.1 undecaprenyl-diphosphate phosphatase [Anianabacter salinae]